MARAWPFKAASSGPLSTGWRYYREHPMAVLVPDQGPPSLYDVSVDPDLQADLAAAMPGLAARLADAARREIGDGPDNPFMDTMSAELRANLEALGYVAETAP